MESEVRQFVFPARRGYRRRILALIIGLGTLASGALFLHLRHLESGIMKSAFREAARDRLHAVTLRFEADLDVVVTLRSLFESSEVVSRHEFKRFTELILSRHGAIMALEWAPRVEGSRLKAFEEAAQAEFPGYRVFDKDPSEQRLPSSPRAIHHPVLFIEPMNEANRGVLGLDVLSGPRRRDTLERARHSGNLAVSEPLQLLQTPDTSLDGIICALSYRGRGDAASPEGYLIGVFRLKDIVEAALEGSGEFKADIVISEERAGDDAVVLREGRRTLKTSDAVFATSLTSKIGDRTWRFEARAPMGDFDHLRTLNPWVAYTSGLAMTALLAYLYVVLGTRSHFAQEQVIIKTRELQELNKRLDALARTDGLTGLLNRRALNEALDSEVDRSHRNAKPLSVLMADLDHFKRVNDTYGHATGDMVLKGFATVMKKRLRTTDIIGRYGGEEFCVILPETGPSEAMTLAEELRRELEATPLESNSLEPPLHVTCSLGVASDRGSGAKARELLVAADKALYAAKEGGRNRVMLSTAPGIAAV